MSTQAEMTPRAAWMLVLAAAAILMITMGARLTTGLFMSPINTSTGLGIASISFALAIGQFTAQRLREDHVVRAPNAVVA